MTRQWAYSAWRSQYPPIEVVELPEVGGNLDELLHDGRSLLQIVDLWHDLRGHPVGDQVETKPWEIPK